MPVTLKNTSKKIRTFHLPKSCDCEELPGTTIQQFRTVKDKHGKARYRPKKMRMPPVLTMLPGEVRAGLPDQVLASPDVKKALANPRDGLRLIEQKAAPKPRPKAEAKPKPAPKPKAKPKTDAPAQE